MSAPQDRAPRERVRQKRITIALVACMAVGIVCFFSQRSTEPTYRDKSLSEWVMRLYAKYPRRDPEALEALRAMGQPAVRALISRVEHNPSPWRIRLAERTADIPVVNDLFSVSVGDRLFSAKALGELGPTAKSAIPALERATNGVDSSLSLAAQAALIRIRQESMEPLISTLRRFEGRDTARASFLLMELGPYASSALPVLMEGMQSTNERVRFFATQALSYVGCESPESIPPLQRLLSDPAFTVRYRALYGLANLGPPAKAALPDVRQCLQDTNAMVRANALMFFDKVLSEEEFSAVRDEVVRAKQDTNSTVSDIAQYVLRRRHRSSGNVTNR